MTNKGIAKRKLHRKKRAEWKAEVLKTAKYFYENCPPVIPELDLRMSPEVRAYFEGIQTMEVYFRSMGIRPTSSFPSASLLH